MDTFSRNELTDIEAKSVLYVCGSKHFLIINNDQSTKQVANSNLVKSETYTGSLNVSIDPYFDRHIYNQTA